MRNNSKYKFYLKKVGDLTKQEKKQMMQLMIISYPALKKYYLKNKYYSTVRPQMENLIKDGDRIIGVGKLLWRKIIIGTEPIKFFVFGVLIRKHYQGKGLGTELIKNDIKEARKREADILYGSTSNSNAERIIRKLGFQKLNVPVFYKDIGTKMVKRENDRVWVFEYKKGLIKKIENSKRFYIGTGPL